MRKRCPESKFIGVGRLHGYELCFRGCSDNAYATVIPKSEAWVPVALYEISEKDELLLDRFEGFPFQYYKDEIMIETEGKSISAMIYIMDLSRKKRVCHAAIIMLGYGMDTQIAVLIRRY